MKATIVEERKTEGLYGLTTEAMIVDTDKHGRLLLTDGYGGNSVNGYAYRWQHGMVVQLQPGDTFGGLNQKADTITPNTVYAVATNGYDDTRPVLDWGGYVIANIVSGLRGVRVS